MRGFAAVLVCAGFALSGCAVAGAVGTVASVAGSVVSTAAAAAGDVVSGAAGAVSGGDHDRDAK